LRRGERGWEKKIQRQGGKYRGEKIDGMDRRKWMGNIEWEQTRGRRRGRGETVIDYGIVNEERETQKRLTEVAREERDRGKRVKIEYRKMQINREWFIWDEREEKLKKNV
jgi:hypothetical protein